MIDRQKVSLITGLSGILVFITVVLSYAIFLLFLNPDFYEQFDGMTPAGYNIDIIDNVNWVRFICYEMVGALISIFSIGLYLLSKESLTSKIAALLFLLSGLIWLSFGLYGLDQVTGSEIGWLMARTFSCLTFGLFGFLLLSNDIRSLTELKISKWIMLSLGIIIIIHALLSLFLSSDYPNILIYGIWLMFFGGIGFIGISMLLAPK